MNTQFANICWGLLACAGLIIAAIGLLWLWLGASFASAPALWTLAVGGVLTVAGAISITD